VVINARKLSEKFLPRYQHVCKYAESCGDNGIQVMAKHFDHCQRRFLNFFHNSEVSDDDIVTQSPPKSGITPYNRFKVPYERICAMAQKSGEAGICVASEEFSACQEELVTLVVEKLCKEKVVPRLKMPSSPRRKARKRQFDQGVFVTFL
jgi:hypothetical protein